jgi:hypothetical protein
MASRCYSRQLYVENASMTRRHGALAVDAGLALLAAAEGRSLGDLTLAVDRGALLERFLVRYSSHLRWRLLAGGT